MGDKRIELQITINDRTYQLGETIDVDVQLSVSKVTNVSEIKLLLRCAESYNKAYSGQVYDKIDKFQQTQGHLCQPLVNP